ncbi:MAG: hypothetical protein FGM15_12980 [Chthoniobacterales bacterium]|nr:hypothetical protein [Chthoniobacterales bacterium]
MTSQKSKEGWAGGHHSRREQQTLPCRLLDSLIVAIPKKRTPTACFPVPPGISGKLMKAIPLLATLALLALLPVPAHARGGGGGFRGGMGEGGFREDAVDENAFRDEEPRVDNNALENANIDRVDDDNFRVADPAGSADVNIRPEGDDTANVNVRTADGKDYDTTVSGPGGYRAGYIWQNGDYVAVNCDPWVAYAAPFGAWAGWNIITQPDYVQYPVYASYPVETAVEVALQKLGLYSGPIDGNAASCASAIEQYQAQNNLPVTGNITPGLLTALGIQASFE